MRLSEWEANLIFGSESDIPPDRLLFHYTSVERAAAIGLTGALALGPLTPMNDPRESQLRQVVTMRTGGPEGAPRVTDEERREFEVQLWQLRGRIRLACFTADQTDGRNSKRDDLRGYAHSRMWTQYAAGQSGVCLAFDRQRLIETAMTTFPGRCHHGSVKYVEGFDVHLAKAEQADFDRPDPARHHRRHVVPGLFFKNVDWESEFEHRLLVDDWDASPCLLPIDGCLLGIATGVAFMPYQMPVIEALAAKFDLGEHVVNMIVNCGVLQGWPSRDRSGNLRVWTEEETRLRDAIFDPEEN